MVISVVLLAVVLGFAVARPAGLPEAVAAVPAAVLTVAAGVVPARAAWDELVSLAPTVGFLAAVLVLAHLADGYGIFRYAGAAAARLAAGRPVRLLTAVFAVAALVTAVLSLDATVVLLTPAVFTTATRVGVGPRPYVYACAHLANSASLLLPVSNLTNLLAVATTGFSFAAFAGLMALPWLVVIMLEYAVFRLFFASDLVNLVKPAPIDDPPTPRYALVVLGTTVAGFAASGPTGVHPAWVAASGAVLLAVPRLRRAPRSVGRLLCETDPAFGAFVVALAVVVLAVRRHGLDRLIEAATPHLPTLAGLLLTAVLAAVLANVVNNLPATLVLVPAVAHSPGLVLAVLIGVNVGPNLTYAGSLATLLWRQILRRRDAGPTVGQFMRLGAVTVPACLTAGVTTLWLVLRLARVS